MSYVKTIFLVVGVHRNKRKTKAASTGHNCTSKHWKRQGCHLYLGAIARLNLFESCVRGILQRVNSLTKQNVKYIKSFYLIDNRIYFFYSPRIWRKIDALHLAKSVHLAFCVGGTYWGINELRAGLVNLDLWPFLLLQSCTFLSN